MKSSIIKTCLFLSIMMLSNCTAKGQGTIVIVTNLGEIELLLYDNTPLHRDNFLKLVNDGFYDGILFHRVIREFMIQGGDPESKNARAGTRFGSGGPGYTVPAEFVPENIHKRGALAAARLPDNINPEKASSGSQFYIVQGKIQSDTDLNNVEMQTSYRNANDMFIQYYREEEAAMRNAGQAVIPDSVQNRASQRASQWLRENPYKMTEENRQIYKTIGGTPHLDGEYTVFGEVVRGFEIIDQIANLETDETDRPRTDVVIRRIRVR